jgi:XRE family transcriptional regulator, fatty acid utilization regulator
MAAPNKSIRRLRESLGLTQREFAEKVGVHQVYVSQLESGSQGLGHQTALRILDEYRREMAELRITLEDLLRGDEGAAA